MDCDEIHAIEKNNRQPKPTNSEKARVPTLPILPVLKWGRRGVLKLQSETNTIKSIDTDAGAMELRHPVK